jgi:hypothetical protein
MGIVSEWNLKWAQNKKEKPTQKPTHSLT